MNRTTDRDAGTRARIEDHWKASESGDIDTEHAIYAADAILDYPQSAERFRGRPKIAAQRGGHPAERHFTIVRISGGGDLWVSECIITYDGAPTYSVSIMEFTGDLVTHETQYFADPFQAPVSRAALAEVLGGTTIRPGEPAYVALAGSWIIINVGGGPTDDKPSVTLQTPGDPDLTSSFLNIRVSDIHAVYADWTARGARFLTPPKQHKTEIRCYLRDPDGYLIEVGQTTLPGGWRQFLTP